MTNKEDFIALCGLDDLADAAIGLGHLPDGRRVAVYLVDGDAYATDDGCTHGNSSLAEDGCLEGYTVECGMHLGKFDVRTGEVAGPPCTKALRTYPVVIRDGQVMLSAAALAGEIKT